MVTPAALRFGHRADAYLEWAVHTRFRYLGGESGHLGLLVQWPDHTAAAWQPLGAAAPSPTEAGVAPVYQHERFANLTVAKDWLRRAAVSGDGLLASAQRLALASPLGSAVPAPEQAGLAPTPIATVNLADSQVLIGCIDDDFPLDHPMCVHPSLGSTRIARLWQQDGGPNDGSGGDTGGDTDVGHGVRPQPRIRHGAHVLDILAGPVGLAQRVPASRDRAAGGDGSAQMPPSWRRAEDLASRAPLSLVTLPRAAIDDPTGRWLGRCVLDGLHHILDTARQLREATAVGGGPHKVVVNLSWGPQTGPHDGSSLLELAMDALVQREAAAGRELHIVLAAGNARDQRAHARWAAAQASPPLVWCVPPAARRPHFLEVWWPAQVAGGAPLLSVTSPDGQCQHIDGPGVWAGPGDAWVLTVVHHQQRSMALLALAPTSADDTAPGAPRAAHGRWQLQVVPQPHMSGDIHVRVARADPNLGARRHSQPSWLWQDGAASRRAQRPGDDLGTGSGLLDAGGTLSGIATGAHTRVAGGHRLSTAQAVRYASAGPTPLRHGPDWSFASEESTALWGRLASGWRAGSVVRLSGTSNAAPQLARELVNGTDTAPLTAVDRPRDPRLGWGRR